jgi:hypothetical protein
MYEDESNVVLAIVALPTPVLPEMTRVFESFKSRCPDCPEPGEPDQQKDAMVIEFGDDTIAIMLMTVPIPWPDLAGPCAASVSHHRDDVV